MSFLGIFNSNNYLRKKSLKFFDKGLSAFQRGDCTDALNKFLKALERLEKTDINQLQKDELIVNNLIIIAQVREKMEQFDLAEQDLKRALSLNPNDIGIYWGLGNLRLDQDQFEEGIPLFEKMIELDPSDPNGYFFRGVCMLEIERYKEAIPDFEQSLKLDPKDDHIITSIGDAYQGLLEFGRAIEFYDKAVALNHQNSNAFVNRGNCKLELGLNVEACKDYHSALELGDTRVQESIDEYCKKSIQN